MDRFFGRRWVLKLEAWAFEKTPISYYSQSRVRCLRENITSATKPPPHHHFCSELSWRCPCFMAAFPQTGSNFDCITSSCHGFDDGDMWSRTTCEFLADFHSVIFPRNVFILTHVLPSIELKMFGNSLMGYLSALKRCSQSHEALSSDANDSQVLLFEFQLSQSKPFFSDFSSQNRNLLGHEATFLSSLW